MKGRRFLSLVLLMVLCMSFSGMVCLAADDKVEPYSYREDLLVSYKEFWYTDGKGVVSHVKYDQQYKSYTFLNGYRELSPKITPLPLYVPMLGNLKPTTHQLVELSYEFY